MHIVDVCQCVDAPHALHIYHDSRYPCCAEQLAQYVAPAHDIEAEEKELRLSDSAWPLMPLRKLPHRGCSIVILPTARIETTHYTKRIDFTALTPSSAFMPIAKALRDNISVK